MHSRTMENGKRLKKAFRDIVGVQQGARFHSKTLDIQQFFQGLSCLKYP
jgi:hypothetical protein